MMDSFKYLPRLIALFYQNQEVEKSQTIPWTPFHLPLNQARFTIITSAGIYLKDSQPPFDLQREQQEPTWGDPSFRIIPATTRPEALAISHLHINPKHILTDINVIFPLKRLAQLAEQGIIGGLAQHCFSVMGYQGFPPNTIAWREQTAPQIIQILQHEGVHGALLTPA
ncbi:MAG: glycine/sarcosine/betaine reductase selenoprotein B family protein [Anaerolineales bacterium]